jgi:hypothetical protein
MVVALGVIVAIGGDALADGAGALAGVGKDRVTSSSIKDGSLLLVDFERSVREKLRGRRGPQGPTGAPAIPAVGKVFRKSETAAVPMARQDPCPMPAGPRFRFSCFVLATTYATATVRCDPREVAVNGGVSSDDLTLVDMSASYPSPDGTGWTATVGNDDATRPHSFTVYVLCVRGTTA